MILNRLWDQAHAFQKILPRRPIHITSSWQGMLRTREWYVLLTLPGSVSSIVNCFSSLFMRLFCLSTRHRLMIDASRLMSIRFLQGRCSFFTAKYFSLRDIHFGDSEWLRVCGCNSLFFRQGSRFFSKSSNHNVEVLPWLYMSNAERCKEP